MPDRHRRQAAGAPINIIGWIDFGESRIRRERASLPASCGDLAQFVAVMPSAFGALTPGASAICTESISIPQKIAAACALVQNAVKDVEQPALAQDRAGCAPSRLCRADIPGATRQPQTADTPFRRSFAASGSLLRAASDRVCRCCACGLSRTSRCASTLNASTSGSTCAKSGAVGIGNVVAAAETDQRFAVLDDLPHDLLLKIVGFFERRLNDGVAEVEQAARLPARPADTASCESHPALPPPQLAPRCGAHLRPAGSRAKRRSRRRNRLAAICTTSPRRGSPASSRRKNSFSSGRVVAANRSKLIR